MKQITNPKRVPGGKKAKKHSEQNSSIFCLRNRNEAGREYKGKSRMVPKGEIDGKV